MITSSVFISIPPVSISENCLSSHVISAYKRSLVTPGVSCTIAIFCPASALNKVDLPTFGRPTIATIGLLISYLPLYYSDLSRSSLPLSEFALSAPAPAAEVSGVSLTSTILSPITPRTFSRTAASYIRSSSFEA